MLLRDGCDFAGKNVEANERSASEGGRTGFAEGAVETLTRAWAAEFGPRGVRVNAVSPGVIRDPEIYGDLHPAELMMAGTPAGGSGTPDAIAAAAVYLASDDAAFVHGAVVDVDVGRTAVAVIANS